MKKVLLFLLLICMISACAKSPAGSSSAEDPTSTFTSTPTSTITPIPSATKYVSQVPIKNAIIIYYDISGSTESELRSSMNSLRPKDPLDGNKPVDAYTDWYISWNWNGYGTDKCNLSSPTVSYKITVKVPRWKAPADASPELIAKWEEYMQNLALHEQEHVDNIVNNYLDVKTAIQGATCSTAEAAAQDVLVELRKFDKKYDLETSHGASQKAVFP